MLINYDTTTIDLKVSDYKNNSKFAIDWFRVSNGNYKAIDRREEADIYQAELKITGDDANIKNIIDLIKVNRDAENHTLTLSEFASDECIFGQHIDYTQNLNVTVLDYSKLKNRSLNTSEFTFEIRLLNPAFTSNTTFPELNFLDFGYETGNTFSAVKSFTIENNNNFIYDDNSDEAIFSGVFVFTKSEAEGLLNNYRINRTSNYIVNDSTIKNFTISDPFGYNYEAGIYCKIIEIKEVSKYGVDRYKFRIRAAKVF